MKKSCVIAIYEGPWFFFACRIIHSMETTSYSLPFPVTHCSLIADIALSSFSQFGHELTKGGEQGSVIVCPTY